MSELKIYCKMKGNRVSSMDSFNDLMDRMAFLILDKAKYQMMWVLRHIEDEFEASGGFILLILNDIKSNLIIEGHGFKNSTLKDDLKEIIPSIRFI